MFNKRTADLDSLIPKRRIKKKNGFLRNASICLTNYTVSHPKNHSFHIYYHENNTPVCATNKNSDLCSSDQKMAKFDLRADEAFSTGTCTKVSLALSASDGHSKHTDYYMHHQFSYPQTVRFSYRIYFKVSYVSQNKYRSLP